MEFISDMKIFPTGKKNMWWPQYYFLPQATKRLGTPLEIGTIEGHFCLPYYIIWQ